MAAGFASRCGQPQPASYDGCHSRNFLWGDSLQLKIAANATSRVEEMPKRYRARVEARFTSRATPRNYTRNAEQIFGNGSPP
jgi:hypothetical protein